MSFKNLPRTRSWYPGKIQKINSNNVKCRNKKQHGKQGHTVLIPSKQSPYDWIRKQSRQALKTRFFTQMKATPSLWWTGSDSKAKLSTRPLGRRIKPLQSTATPTNKTSFPRPPHQFQAYFKPIGKPTMFRFPNSSPICCPCFVLPACLAISSGWALFKICLPPTYLPACPHA